MNQASDTDDCTPSLEFTGERFTPECVREIWYEHFHRYAFAAEMVAGKRVLDAACGEGYGSALLADYAESVVGMDISMAAIEHARQRYVAKRNLRFDQGDCTDLHLGKNQFDVVVSFETLEHVNEQDALIGGFAGVLSENGILVVSSPDKRVYSDVSGFKNEFHVRELYRDELIELLRKHFAFVYLYGQKLLFQSVLWSLDGQTQPVLTTTATQAAGEIHRGLEYDPMYFVAIASQSPLDGKLPALALFGDREETVYRHYNHEITKNMSAGKRIAELESEVAALEKERDTLKHSLKRATAGTGDPFDSASDPKLPQIR